MYYFKIRTWGYLHIWKSNTVTSAAGESEVILESDWMVAPNPAFGSQAKRINSLTAPCGMRTAGRLVLTRMYTMFPNKE